MIENFDPLTYSKYNNNSSAPTTGAAPSNSLVSMANRTGPGLQRMDSVHGRSRELKNFYILSMGHRIQFIQYDDAGVSEFSSVLRDSFVVNKRNTAMIDYPKAIMYDL